MDKINQIKKEIIISMKMMDTTIKNVKESEEYKIAQAYNQGLRDGCNGTEEDTEKPCDHDALPDSIQEKLYALL